MPFRLPWGKTDKGTSHHLAHHCADVAACFAALAALPVIRARMEAAAGRPLSDIDIARLCVIVFLHDCGKLHPGFQAKGHLPVILWPQCEFHGHVQEGAAIAFDPSLGKLAAHLHVGSLRRWGVGEGLLCAALAHHGQPFTLERKASLGWHAVPETGYDPLAASREMGALMREWFAPAFCEGGLTLNMPSDFQHLFCGLVSLADWLGSTRTLFPFVAGCDGRYIERARSQARKAVSDIGLEVTSWRQAIQARAVFSILSPGHTQRAAQRILGEWLLHDLLVILEAETGSGKTEAVLWHFARLFEAGLVDSLYFALPTRAAARQIHARVNAIMKRLFGEKAPEAVLAVPGYLQSGDVSGMALPDFDVLWNDDPDEAVRVSRWAAESGRRYLAATVAVGTVDQAMLAALQVKHAHLRAAALSRSLLVIDEIHASDPYMTAVQEHLLRMHLRRGGHAALMSATLGAEARSRWLARTKRAAVTPSFAEAVAAPYPAVWGREQGCHSAPDPQQRRKRVAMELSSGWSGQTAAARAVEAAARGARVLVIRNTVKAALDTFMAVRASGAEPLLWQVAGGPSLHHSRFAPEDRALLDQQVERALSADRALRPAGGVIVIATQTVEQSLDIDADYLIADLCPADVLLQRIGRLHRHGLARPKGFETPQCLVLSPEGGLERLVVPGFENGLGRFKDGGGVYRNLHACELTRRLVLSHAEWVIPDMNRLLVESAIHTERIEALNLEMGKAWENYWNAVYGKDIADAQSAGHIRLPVDTDFAELGAFACDEQIIRTRLGADGARIVFAGSVPGPFAQAISGVTLPSHWKGVFSKEPVEAESEEGIVRFTVGDATFHYDRTGLRRDG